MRTDRRSRALLVGAGAARCLLVAATIVLAAALTACESANDKKEASSDEPVKIGASLPLTGMFSIPGQNHRRGYELCVDVLNQRGGLLGRKVELKVNDNRSDTETVVNQTERFINADKVDLLLGTFSTLLSFPASAIAEQNRMLYLEPSDSSLQSHSRRFRFNFGFTLKPIDFIGQTPVDAIADLQTQGAIQPQDAPKTAAVVYQDDFFPSAISRGLRGGTLKVPGASEQVDFAGYLKEKGIEVVYAKKFPADFNGWVSLANQVKASGADYLFALTVPPTEVELAKALRTVKYRPKGAFFSQGTYPEFKESLGEAVDGIIVWSTWSPTARWEGEINGKPFTNQDFVKAFQAKFGKAPDEDMAQAFTVCQAAAQAVDKADTLDNAKLRDWLAERSADDPIKTIQGDYHFDDKGLTADRDVLLLQWQDGELKQIYPTGDEYPDVAKIVWPTPNW